MTTKASEDTLNMVSAETAMTCNARSTGNRTRCGCALGSVSRRHTSASTRPSVGFVSCFSYRTSRVDWTCLLRAFEQFRASAVSSTFSKPSCRFLRSLRFVR